MRSVEHLRGALLGLAGLLAGLGCGPAPIDGAPFDPRHPLDDRLTLDHVQARGTHNSYHVETTALAEWRYTHAPLAEQLDGQGVRQLELDVYWDDALGGHRVLHIPVIDAGTTCERFTDCLDEIDRWSRAHPGHHPLLVLVETKTAWGDDGPRQLDVLDDELLGIWPEERLIAPDLVQGPHPDLRSALADDGWPTLGELRGRALFVLHDGGARRERYTSDLRGRPMFPDAYGDLDAPFAAVHTLNDPYDPRIAEVVGQGHLVRTRADADTEEARAEDTTRRDQAFASGAHYVSTDFPAPVDWTSYVVEVPGGSPSRCNPARAPSECAATDVEDPARLGP